MIRDRKRSAAGRTPLPLWTEQLRELRAELVQAFDSVDSDRGGGAVERGGGAAAEIGDLSAGALGASSPADIVAAAVEEC